ncbi:MAG: hypothetical protein K2X68_06650 [Novosphingobium sp.]|nr:hypothetical protein [Novosphingobium sp.]
MHILDRRMILLWLTVTAGAVLAVLLEGVVAVLLMLSIVGIPLALLLDFMPGVWIYLTPMLGIYAMLRKVANRTAPVILLLIASIPPLSAGVLIPRWANGVTEERVNALLAQDHGTPPTLPAGLSITHAIDRGHGSSGGCSETCQRLLFSRTAKSIVEVPLDMMPSATSLPNPVHRYSLGPIGPGCENSGLRAAYASTEEIGRMIPPPPPLLWEKLNDLAGEGLCLHDDAVRDARSDVLVVERWNYDPTFSGFSFSGKGWRLSLHPIEPFNRREVFRRTPSGLVRQMRRTEVRYARLYVPLWITPGFSFDIRTPTHWTWQNEQVAGRQIEKYVPTQWNGIIANDLSVHGLR